jgi:hypothetical protein
MRLDLDDALALGRYVPEAAHEVARRGGQVPLVDSLDSSGQIVAQRVEWLVGSNLPGFSTTYFEAPIRQQASDYRVSVFALDFAESARIEPQAP